MKYLTSKIWIAIVVIFSVSTSCLSQETKQNLTFNINNKTTLNYLIENQIKEQYQFSGLATYLNQVQYYIVDKQNIYDIDRTSDETYTLDENQWFAISARFDVLLIKSNNAKITFVQENPSIVSNDANTKSFIVGKPNLKTLAPELDQIRYNHLWKPFAIVAKLSESLLALIKSTTSLSWGISILLFALIIKLLLLPVALMTSKSQQKVSKITSQLQPKLKAIKSKYDGEQAHNKIMQAHKDLGVSPFYTLKPMLSFLIQIPILIAIFNALGEMPQLLGQPFMWFDDLSKPDMLSTLSFNIPFMGSYLNLMPILMTIITLVSTVFHTDNHASISENKKQKIKLYLMAFSFLVLFYPFPAAMVMYWAMANLLQFLQVKLIPKRNS